MARESTASSEEQAQPGADFGAACYWDIRDIQFHCRMGRSTAWRLVRDDGFPAPVLWGKRIVLWPRDEVMVFLEGRRDREHYRREAVPAPNSPPSFVSRAVRQRPTRDGRP